MLRFVRTPGLGNCRRVRLWRSVVGCPLWWRTVSGDGAGGFAGLVVEVDGMGDDRRIGTIQGREMGTRIGGAGLKNDSVRGGREEKEEK